MELNTAPDAVLVGHSHLHHAVAGWSGGLAVGYNSYVILNGADVKEVGVFAYRAWHSVHSKLSGMDKGEASSAVSQESTQESSKLNNSGDPKYPALGYSNVVSGDN